MNLIDSLYENEDLSTDEGIEGICEKIKNLNVSKLAARIVETQSKHFLFSKSKFQDGVNVRLEELLGRQSKIERQMNNIGRSLAVLKVSNDESNKVNSMIENTSVLAENVSAKVRRLDEARVICITLNSNKPNSV